MTNNHTNETNLYYDNFIKTLKKEKNLVRNSILQGVTLELATALKKDKWFMSNVGFGVGVFSDGVNDDGEIMESRCYHDLEIYFRDNSRGAGLTTKEIVKSFSESYLRHYFMHQWIKQGGYQYKKQ